MEKLIRFFLERKLLVHLLVAALVVSGAVVASRTQREGFPNVTLNLMVITAALPGASASEIETDVTLPIEEALEGLDGVDTYSSVIQDNLSITTVEIDPDFETEQIRRVERDARQRIDAIPDFPEEMTQRPMIEVIEAGRLPVAEVALGGDPDQLPAAARRLEAALERVDGVSTVSVVGLEDPEVRILYDPVRGREHGVALVDLISAVERQNTSSTGGVLETESDRQQVVLDARFRDPEAVGDVVLRFLPNGSTLRVSDVATVEMGREDRGLRVHTNGRPGVSLVVRKRASADILQTVDDVRETIESTPLPEGVSCTIVNDASFLARNRLELVISNALAGIALVVALVFLFLSRRAAIWVSLGVPTVVAAVLVLMPALGMTVNMISLAGFVVVLGMLVDDAVVVAERIELRRGQGLSGDDASVRGTLDVFKPVVAAALTTMLAFSPMLALGGLPGKLVWYIPAVVVLCLLFSIVESALILPSHMAGHGSEGEAEPKPASKPKNEKRRFVLFLEEKYRRALGPILRYRYLVLAGFVLVFGLTVFVLAPRMPFVLFPQDDTDALFLKIRTEPGTPLEGTEAVVTALERQIPALVGGDLLAVTSRTGHQHALALDRTQGSAENEAVISVLLHPERSQRTRTAAEWSEYLSDNLRVAEGVEVVYEPKVLGPPVGRPVTIHVASNDDEARRATAAAVAERIGRVDGVVDVEMTERPGMRQIDLRLDHEQMALRGLDAEVVGMTLSAAFYGVRVSEVRDLDETTGFRVMFDPSSRRSLDDLLDTPMRNRRGDLVVLREVVRPVEVASVSQIHHRDGVRTVTITAGFTPASDHTATSFARWLEGEVLPQHRSAEVDVFIGGEAAETEEVMGDLTVVALLAVIGVLLVIWLMLGSLIETVFVIAAIPFGAVGIVLAVAAHGLPLSMFVALAAIGLAGVVVNDSILMIDGIKTRLADVAGQGAEVQREAMIEAVVERLRPVMVTTVTTLGGVLPLGYGLGGHDAMLSPMSLALGWGLAFTTIITLFLIPATFAIAADLKVLAARALRRAPSPSSPSSFSDGRTGPGELGHRG